MKIVINAFSARLGGGQTYLKNLLAHLPQRADLELVVYAPASLKLPEDPRVRRADTRWPTQNPLLRTLWEKWRLPQILRDEKAQVLFCPGGVIATRAPAPCKTVTMFRNMIPFDPVALARIPMGLQRLRNLMLKRVMLRSMAEADLTIFISNYARQTIERLRSIRNPVTIPHGINADFRSVGKTLARPDWLPQGPYILYVSRFDDYKHQPEVAQGFCSLPPALRDSHTLIFVGEVTAAQSQQMAQLANQHGAAQQVMVAGAKAYADLPALYQHAKLNLFASSCENCPNILLEAMASGRPLLSSDVEPMPELGGDACAYFSPFDPHSIRDTLLRVLSQPELQATLAQNAQRQSAQFDWAKSAAKTWQAIFKLA